MSRSRGIEVSQEEGTGFELVLLLVDRLQKRFVFFGVIHVCQLYTLSGGVRLCEMM